MHLLRIEKQQVARFEPYSNAPTGKHEFTAHEVSGRHERSHDSAEISRVNVKGRSEVLAR